MGMDVLLGQAVVVAAAAMVLVKLVLSGGNRDATF